MHLFPAGSCTTDENQYFFNQVQLPLADGIGSQSTQSSEALLSCLSVSFGGSPPVTHRCYPYHQILLIGIKTKTKVSIKTHS
jgi:hypothetical protein